MLRWPVPLLQPVLRRRSGDEELHFVLVGFRCSEGNPPACGSRGWARAAPRHPDGHHARATRGLRARLCFGMWLCGGWLGFGWCCRLLWQVPERTLFTALAGPLLVETANRNVPLVVGGGSVGFPLSFPFWAFRPLLLRFSVRAPAVFSAVAAPGVTEGKTDAFPGAGGSLLLVCLLYTSPSPRDS